MKVLSLATTNITINNPIKGQISLGGAGGKLLGSIQYNYQNAPFTIQTTPDGGAAYSHNASRAGTITISIMQTSDYCDILDEFIAFCRSHPAEGISDIIIKDTAGCINISAKDCAPAQAPGKTIGASAQERAYSFYSAIIDDQLTGGSN